MVLFLIVLILGLRVSQIYALTCHLAWNIFAQDDPEVFLSQSLDTLDHVWVGRSPAQSYNYPRLDQARTIPLFMPCCCCRAEYGHYVSDSPRSPVCMVYSAGPLFKDSHSSGGLLSHQWHWSWLKASIPAHSQSSSILQIPKPLSSGLHHMPG